MVLVGVLPVTVMPAGLLVIVQFSGEGKPLNTTLPVGTLHVGWVGVPATGAEGTTV